MTWVYILSNKDNRVLYIGVTSDLNRRILEHKSHHIEGFTQRYRCDKLVYFEEYDTITQAIEREKVLKVWRRKWKYDLIRTKNPMMVELWG